MYLYFASKDQVLLECHHRLRRGMAAQIAGTVADVLGRLEAGRDSVGAADGLAELVEQMVEAAVAYARENRDLCEVCTKVCPAARSGPR